MIELSKNHLHILQHSLGVDQYGHGAYRNHYVAGGKDVALCREIVALGFMEERTGSELSGGDPLFLVTPEGELAMRANCPKPPKLSRSKQRYRRFLEYRDWFESFLDFCRWDAQPERSWNGGAS